MPHIAGGATAGRATRQDFSMHHKIIGEVAVEGRDGAEDSIVSCALDFTSQAAVAHKPCRCSGPQTFGVRTSLY